MSVRPRAFTRVGLVLSAVAFTSGAGVALAQSPLGTVEPAIPEKAGKELRAFRISGAPPRIDGRFDEDVWRSAPMLDDLTQQEPDNMERPRERTAVQVAYDDRYLYIAARCDTRDPATITAGLGRRGSIPPSDRITIFFDPRHDHQTGYAFMANASGVQHDYALLDDTREDPDYEAVWDVATAIVGSGWAAEFRIPFSQIRFTTSSGPATVWGFQIRRDVQRTGEWDQWVASPRGTQGRVSRFGHLVFNDRLTPPARIEMTPFTLARQSVLNDGTSSTGLAGGLDLRVGLGTAATLSATINPDFGHVELDPSVLNLSVFETFYPEKRPFFLEDSRVFSLPYGTMPMFHSRRIGRSPGRFSLDDDDTLIHQPADTTILGAVKVTGKTAGWTYGGLGALTAREYATVEATATAPTGAASVTSRQHLIEPLTMYSVGRVQRDIRNGTSNVGVIATAVVREKDVDAFAGGGDFNIRWDRNRYNVNGHWVATHAPIDGVRRTDVGGVTNFTYNGKHFGSYSHYDRFGSNFRNTDLGFLNARPNRNWAYSGVRFSLPDPGRLFRGMDSEFFANKQWTDDGLSIYENVNWYVGVRFHNYWNVNYNGDHNFEVFDDLDTRGGPPIVKPARTGYNINLNSDSRKRWGINLGHNGNRDAAGGWQRNVSATVRLQPSGRLQTTIGATVTAARDSAQWITNEDADGDGVEDHVYGRLKRNIINITARGTYAFSRDLTLELFLQPFVAVGDYTDFRKLSRPGTFEFQPVALEDDPDFNRKNLRGNAVLRWEYARGSTMFVVWTLATSDQSRPGRFAPMRDLGSAFGAPGDHVLVVKMSYWLSR
jgi:hypothetical protein